MIKQVFELKKEGISNGVLTMQWGDYRANKFGTDAAIVQLLVNGQSGSFKHGFSDQLITKDTILTIEGLPENINSILITVI